MGILQPLINLGELCLGIFNFIIFGVKTIFTLIGRLILKVFSFDTWEIFFDFIDDLSIYLGDYTIYLITGLMLLMLIRFFKFIIGLIKGRREDKKGL